MEEYKDDYVLKLYVDGELSDDYYVEYQTNCSTFSTVLTNKIGRYTVYYKAYSKNNYISSEQAIIFNVIDITPPKVKLISDPVMVEFGSRLSDINFYTLSDDTTLSSNISVTLNDKSVIYDNLGKYQATIQVADLYGNITTKNFSVKIVDNTPPNIIIINPLVFNYLEDVNWSEYVSCQDNYDNDITQLINVSNLDTSKLGKGEIIIEVCDYSNNKTSVTVEAIVVDKDGPILNLIKEDVTLDIIDFSQYDSDYFMEYIYNYSDNYSNKENIIIEVDTSSLCENVADFYVWISATDENNNKTIKNILVRLREFIGPLITGPDTIDIKIGEQLDLSNLVEVSDEYDDDAGSRLVIDDGGFDNLTAGVYKVKFTSFNTSGIYTEKIVTINVICEEKEDNLFPLILIGSGVMLIAAAVTIILVRRKRRFH